MSRAVDRRIEHELGGSDEAVERHVGPAIGPTPERIAKLKVPLRRISAQMTSESRIIPRLEELRGQGRITENMLAAARYYAALAFVADGPSQGIGRYGDWQQASPNWQRMITSDERMLARRMFDAARKAAFGLRDRDGEWTFDELARHAIEPLILGDDQAMTMGDLGRHLTPYRSRSGASAAGTAEVGQVLRRLRLFFRLADDD